MGRKYARAYVTQVVLKKIYVGQYRCPEPSSYERTNQCVSPDLPISPGSEKLAHIPGFGFRVTSIVVNAVDDELGLPLVEELPGFVCLVGEIDQSPVSDDSEEYCEGSFDDKDPSPPGKTFATVQLHQLTLVRGMFNRCVSVCLTPYARIPAQADARDPRM